MIEFQMEKMSMRQNVNLTKLQSDKMSFRKSVDESKCQCDKMSQTPEKLNNSSFLYHFDAKNTR